MDYARVNKPDKVDWSFCCLPDNINFTECWRALYTLYFFQKDWSYFLYNDDLFVLKTSLINASTNVPEYPIFYNPPWGPFGEIVMPHFSAVYPDMYDLDDFCQFYWVKDIYAYLSLCLYIVLDIIISDLALDCYERDVKKSLETPNSGYLLTFSADELYKTAYKVLNRSIGLPEDAVLFEPGYTPLNRFTSLRMNLITALRDPLGDIPNMLVQIYTFFTKRDYFYPPFAIVREHPSTSYAGFPYYIPQVNKDIKITAYREDFAKDRPSDVYESSFAYTLGFDDNNMIFSREPLEVFYLSRSNSHYTHIHKICFDVPEYMEFIEIEWMFAVMYSSSPQYKVGTIMRGSSKSKEIDIPFDCFTDYLHTDDDKYESVHLTFMSVIKVLPKDKKWITPVETEEKQEK